jgi:polysaccharide chain length determinant protein (PEP-CTERM system associated)
MPGAQGDYFTRLQNELDAIKKAQAALTIASTRRDELQRQLRGDAAITGSTTAGNRAEAGGNDTASRIAETQTRLEELMLRFTDKHPDVIALRETLQQLQDRRAEELSALRRGDASVAVRSGVSSNPVYQSIQLQLNQADVEVAALRRELYDHNQKVAELRSVVNSAPEVEAQYAGLNRDYTVTQQTYQSLVDRLDKTRLGDEAGESGSVQLSVVDPPNADFEPVSPKRFLLIPLTLLVGLGLGGSVAYLLHQMRPVFVSGNGLAAFTGLPLLGVVSLMWPERQQLASRNSYLRYSLLVGGLIFVCAVVLWKQDPWSSAIRRMLGDRNVT